MQEQHEGRIVGRRVRRARREGGVALLLVIVAVSLVVVLASGFLSGQSTNLGITQNLTRQSRARGIAESALRTVIQEVQANANWRDDYTNGIWVSDEAFAGGTFTVWGVDGMDEDGSGAIENDESDGDLSDDAADPITLTVEGEFQGVKHKVSALIRVTPASGDIPFEIDGGEVIPEVPFSAKLTVIGAGIEAFGFKYPVTLQLVVDNVVTEPFGAFGLPLDGNVNDDSNPRQYTVPGEFASDSTISVNARSWRKKFLTNGSQNSHYNQWYTVNSSDDSPVVLTLRDGDDVPDIKGWGSQADVEDYLEGYIDLDTNTVTLSANQAIYLFELSTTNPNSSTADFQDVVVLVDLYGAGTAPVDDGGGSGDDGGGSGGGGGATYHVTWLE